MENLILKTAQDVLPYVSQIAAIADQNKVAFGFLAASAYEQMALKGQLWIAVNNQNEIKGYLIFGGTMPTIKVFQIYVCTTSRGACVGRKLIGALKEYAKERHYHSISAKVASDLPANKFWEAVGFRIYRQVPGSEQKKRIINIRGFSLCDNDLFGAMNAEPCGVKPNSPVLDKPVYALDLNLLLDIFKAREGYKKVIKIMQLGFQGKFSICVTPEFKLELERQSANFPDDPVLRLAQAFPELKGRDVAAAVDKMRSIVFPFRNSDRKAAKNDESDLKHLGYCVSAGIDGFITREKAMLRACDRIKDEYGVTVLSPDELIFDDSDQLNALAPINSDFLLSNTSVTEEVMTFLAGFSVPEKILKLFNSNLPFGDEILVYEARFDGHLFGIYFAQKPLKTRNYSLAALYLDEACPKSTAAIDHFLESMLRFKSAFSFRLDVHIGKDQDQTEETLLKKGFFKLSGHFVKIISCSFLDAKNWTRFAKDIKTFCGLTVPESLPSKKELINTGVTIRDQDNNFQAFSWFDFETIIGPRFVVNSDRDCILVPIRENYARGLIGNVKNQLSLLSSHDKSLLLEKAYFRSCSKSSLFKRGGIVAFYVSGANSIQEIIGFARITYSDVISVDEAAIKVDRQGVLSRDELTKIADKSGKIHVFTFDNFLEFDRRLSFSRAKELGLIGGANLVSPEQIDVDKLKVLIGEVFSD